MAVTYLLLCGILASLQHSKRNYFRIRSLIRRTIIDSPFQGRYVFALIYSKRCIVNTEHRCITVYDSQCRWLRQIRLGCLLALTWNLDLLSVFQQQKSVNKYLIIDTIWRKSNIHRFRIIPMRDDNFFDCHCSSFPLTVDRLRFFIHRSWFQRI